MKKEVDCIYWDSCARKGGGGGCCQLDSKLNPSFGYCEQCDERTARLRGVGDTVTKLIHTVTLGKLKPKKGCGCSKRRKTLNKLFPYKKS